MPHAFLLIAATTVFPYAGMLVLALRAGRPADLLANTVSHPLLAVECNVALIAVVWGLIASSTRAVTTMAFSVRGLRRALPLVACTCGLLALTLVTCVCGLARRGISLADVGALACVTAALLLALVMTARLLAALERPYREWLPQAA